MAADEAPKRGNWPDTQRTRRHPGSCPFLSEHQGSAEARLRTFAAAYALTLVTLRVPQPNQGHRSVHCDERWQVVDPAEVHEILSRSLSRSGRNASAHTAGAHPYTKPKSDDARHQGNDVPGQPWDKQDSDQREDEVQTRAIEHMHGALLSGKGLSRQMTGCVHRKTRHQRNRRSLCPVTGRIFWHVAHSCVRTFSARGRKNRHSTRARARGRCFTCPGQC